MYENKAKHLMLILTHDCNLNCKYCYETKESGRVIPFNVAIDKINKEDNLQDGYGSFIIEFFGGEPLLEFDLITRIYDWTMKHVKHKNVQFFLTTNGTLLNDRMKNWFTARRENFILCLSLDGGRVTQEYNRPGSFDLIAPHFSFFRENWPHQSVKMTISPYSLSRVAKDIIFIHSMGFVPDSGFAYDRSWERVKNWPELLNAYEDNLHKLIDFYINNPALEKTRILNYRLVNIGKPMEHRWCGTGKAITAVDTNGKEYPCQMFTPFVLGRELDEIEKSNLINKLLSFKSYSNSPCKNCPFSSICPTCAGIGLLWYNDINHHVTTYCELNKLSIKATAVLRLKEIYRDVDSGKLSGLSPAALSYIQKEVESIEFIKSTL